MATMEWANIFVTYFYPKENTQSWQMPQWLWAENTVNNEKEL